MCGILGLVNRSGEPADREVFSKMLDTLNKRGPDQTGVLMVGFLTKSLKGNYS